MGKFIDRELDAEEFSGREAREGTRLKRMACNRPGAEEAPGRRGLRAGTRSVSPRGTKGNGLERPGART